MSPTARMFDRRPPLPDEWIDTSLQWRLEGVALGLRAVGLSGRVYRVTVFGLLLVEPIGEARVVLHQGEMVRAMVKAQEIEDHALARARRELQEVRG